MANKKTKNNGPIVKVEGPEEFYREAARLKKEGFIEVPGFLGAGSDGAIKADYASYVSSMLETNGDAGSKSKNMLPLLHVSSGTAIPMKAENGHTGNMITWGAANKIPNVISLLCSLSPYTAAALKFNIDLCCGMGPQPMYAYTQYVAGNITQKQIRYENADKLILGLIRDLQLQMIKLEEENPELKDSARGQVPGSNQPGVPVRGLSPDSADSDDSEKSAAQQMYDDLKQQIADLRKDLAIWQQTNEELQLFLKNNNLLQTFQQLYSDILQYNICFPEFELQQTYLVDSEKKDKNGKPIKKAVQTSVWEPKIIGLKWRNAKTMRLEQLNNENKIEHVYISNQWLQSPEQTVITKDSDFKVDAIPSLSYQSPVTDLERLVRKTRNANGSKKTRPTHVAMPVCYNEYGHPYYPVPAWYSVFSGDVYTYASLLISDRKKRRDNANVIGRILYLNDEYMQRLYYQRGDDTDEKKKARFNEVISDINNFLKNRDNMGEPLLAYTFKDSEGKVYKSWEIVEVQENSAATAEANKEELAEISSIILFAWGADSQLIGNTPGTTTRSGGTDLRERYLLKQINMSLMQSLVLKTLDVVKFRNQWDSHLLWQIKKQTLTTLDNSKTGIAESESN